MGSRRVYVGRIRFRVVARVGRIKGARYGGEAKAEGEGG